MPETFRDAFTHLPYNEELNSCDYFVTNTPTLEKIEAAAYFRWLQLGRPQGQDLSIWLYAKELCFNSLGRKLE
jgi:hypothetical protein